jgi:hypothetical protein
MQIFRDLRDRLSRGNHSQHFKFAIGEPFMGKPRRLGALTSELEVYLGDPGRPGDRRSVVHVLNGASQV